MCRVACGNNGGYIAIFEAVEEGLDGIDVVPWGCKCHVVGLALGGSRNAVGSTEDK